MRAGRVKELKDYLARQSDNEKNQTLLVCADAIYSGAEAGIQKAGEVSGVEARLRVLSTAAQTLIAVRRYDLAADLLAAAAAGAGNPAAVTNLIEILRKTKRAEELPQTIRGPEDAIRDLIIRVLLAEKYKNGWVELLSPFLLDGETPDDFKNLAREMGSQKNKLQASGLTMEAALDIGLSAAVFSREGNDQNGWVVRMVTPSNGTAAAGQQVCFLIREGETYRVLAANRDFSGVARLVLQLAGQGKAEEARIWLDRIRQELPAGSGDDPLSGPLFSRVWQQGQTADADGARLAAALLLTRKEKGIASVIEILAAALKSAGADTVDAISAALAEAYYTDKQYGRALAVSEDLMRKLPQSPSALRLLLQAAYASGGSKEAARIATAHLDGFKNNTAALRAAAVVALSFGDAERATAIEEQIVDSGRAQAGDYNELVWATLIAGKVTPKTLELANRAMMVSNNGSAPIMHTLAAVEAELDKPSEARTTLLQRISALGEDEPDDNDWYVFGRIAESYGLKQEAATMYRRLERPKDEQSVPSSSYALAERRLKSTDLAQ